MATDRPARPDVKPGGRTRKSEVREVPNGLLSLARQVGSWRARPHGLPRRETRGNFLRRFEADSTRDAMMIGLRVEVRAGPGGAKAGTDAGQMVRGRGRPLVATGRGRC